MHNSTCQMFADWEKNNANKHNRFGVVVDYIYAVRHIKNDTLSLFENTNISSMLQEHFRIVDTWYNEDVARFSSTYTIEEIVHENNERLKIVLEFSRRMLAIV